MCSRPGFVVGTVNGKPVAYIVDRPGVSSAERNRSPFIPATPQDASRTSRPSLSTRPSTSASSISQHDLEEAARVNGSVTLSHGQLQELLALLDRHVPSSPGFSEGAPRAQEAWLASASSCSGSEHSAPATPAEEEEDAAPRYPIPLEDEVPTRDRGPDCSREEHHHAMKAPLSLLEQKKLQWAQERAELEGLNSPWGRNGNEPLEAPRTKQLADSPPTSLPPVIMREHAVSPIGYVSDYGDSRMTADRYAASDRYNGHSDRINGTIDRYNGNTDLYNGTKEPPSVSPPISLSNANLASKNNHHSHQHSRSNSRELLSVPSVYGGTNSADETNSHISTKSVRFTARTPGEGEERPRWGDKGVGVGHLWEPSPEPSARLPDASSPGGGPAWLERSLSRLGPSPDPPEMRTGDRSPQPMNFLRGQNVPIDPVELEERDRRRQKALEHQKAIKQQLEEREKRRREEREQRLLLERQEEERVRREQELERSRLEEERRREIEIKRAKEAAEQESKPQHQGPGRGKFRARRAREPDKPINLSPRILDMSHRPRSELEACRTESSRYGNGADLYMGQTAQQLQLGPAGREELVMFGQEVAVLLAPELEQRLQLGSRAGRDQTTQTETPLLQPKNRKRTSRSLAERPQWGAHRSTQRYIKQSDKDKYRQRGTSLPTPPKPSALQQSKVTSMSRESRGTTQDSTEESDRSPPVCLARRRMAQDKVSPSRGCHRPSSDEELTPVSGCWGREQPQVWSHPREQAQVWSNPREQQGWTPHPHREQSWSQPKEQGWSNHAVVPPPLQSPAQLHDLQRTSDFDAFFYPPVRNTCSPPVPALAKKLEKQPDLARQAPRREPRRPPLRSPPVPAVMKRLQTEASTEPTAQLPCIEPVGNKSAPPAMQQQQQHGPGVLPDIRPRDASSAVVPPLDILSQLSTLRRALQTKQHEWEVRSDTPFSDS